MVRVGDKIVPTNSVEDNPLGWNKFYVVVSINEGFGEEFTVVEGGEVQKSTMNGKQYLAFYENPNPIDRRHKYNHQTWGNNRWTFLEDLLPKKIPINRKLPKWF